MRARDPATGGEMGTQGVYESYLGTANFVELDQHTIKITTSKPMADLLDLLVAIPIAPESALGNIRDTPVGSGPYALKDAGNQKVLMQSFPRYWRKKTRPRSIRWEAEPKEENRVKRLISGDADIACDIGSAHPKSLKKSGLRIIDLPSQLSIIFLCNIFSGLCVDKRIRQALNFALDVPKIVETVRGGAAAQMNGPLSTLHFGYDPLTKPYLYDPEKARGLLKEAGCAIGTSIILDVPTSSPNEAPLLAKLMCEYYTKVDINAELRIFEDREAYAEMVRAKKINDACCFDSSPISTYRVLREKLHSGYAGPWWEGYSNPNVNALISQAEGTVEIKRRRRLYRQAYRLIRDDAPWVFLYNPKYFWGIGKKVRKWAPTFDGLIGIS
jgi:peptide/nickel transport system substrate-binding protein